MADYLELNRSYLSQLESGKRPISGWIVKRVNLLSRRHPASFVEPSTGKALVPGLIERLRRHGRLHEVLGLEVFTDEELWKAYLHFDKARRGCPEEAWPIYNFVLNQIMDEYQKRGGAGELRVIKEKATGKRVAGDPD